METMPHNPALGPQSGPAGFAGNPPTYAEPAQTSHRPPQSVSEHDDAPPSYEDAIASDLPPLIGPRPGYRPPAAPEGESRITGDEKR